MAAIFGVFRCQKNNLPFKVIRRFSTFAEFLVERENESLKIDLALDSSYRFEPLLELAAQKDPGFDNYWFALALNHCENFPDDLLPDKLRISMRKVSERDRDRQVEIQEIFENAQSHLKKAQITTICAMNNKVKFLSERPKSDINNPEISQTSGLHQSCQTAWV